MQYEIFYTENVISLATEASYKKIEIYNIIKSLTSRAPKSYSLSLYYGREPNTHVHFTSF